MRAMLMPVSSGRPNRRVPPPGLRRRKEQTGGVSSSDVLRRVYGLGGVGIGRCGEVAYRQEIHEEGLKGSDRWGGDLRRCELRLWSCFDHSTKCLFMSRRRLFAKRTFRNAWLMGPFSFIMYSIARRLFNIRARTQGR